MIDKDVGIRGERVEMPSVMVRRNADQICKAINKTCKGIRKIRFSGTSLHIKPIKNGFRGRLLLNFAALEVRW